MPASAVARATPHDRTLRSALIAAGVAIALAGGWAFWGDLPGTVDAPRTPTSFVLTTPPDGPLRVYGDLPQVAFSPDGTKIAYAAGYGGDSRRRIYVRDLSEVEARPLPGTERGDHPFFSSDGTQVGFRRHDAIRRTPVEGGPVQTVLEPPQVVPVAWSAGMTWGPDDTIVFSTTRQPGSTPGLGRRRGA